MQTPASSFCWSMLSGNCPSFRNVSCNKGFWLDSPFVQVYPYEYDSVLPNEYDLPLWIWFPFLQVYPYEYDLVLCPDVNTKRHTQWYVCPYFSSSSSNCVCFISEEDGMQLKLSAAPAVWASPPMDLEVLHTYHTILLSLQVLFCYLEHTQRSKVRPEMWLPLDICCVLFSCHQCDCLRTSVVSCSVASNVTAFGHLRCLVQLWECASILLHLSVSNYDP